MLILRIANAKLFTPTYKQFHGCFWDDREKEPFWHPNETKMILEAALTQAQPKYLGLAIFNKILNWKLAQINVKLMSVSFGTKTLNIFRFTNIEFSF